MPIPDPTTPKDSSVQCHHGGPKLDTPDLKPYSLSGDKNNRIMFVKSRSGNLISFDDEEKTLRLQDKTGNAEIRLLEGCIEIKQKAGDINWVSKKETRFDCTTFEVHATNDISFAAGTDITLTCGDMFTESGKDTSFGADKDITFNSWNTSSLTAMGELTCVGKKMVSVGTKTGNQNYMSTGQITMSAKKDLGISTGAALTITGVGGCDFKSSDKITLTAAAVMTGMAMCININ